MVIIKNHYGLDVSDSAVYKAKKELQEEKQSA